MTALHLCFRRWIFMKPVTLLPEGQCKKHFLKCDGNNSMNKYWQNVCWLRLVRLEQWECTTHSTQRVDLEVGVTSKKALFDLHRVLCALSKAKGMLVVVLSTEWDFPIAQCPCHMTSKMNGKEMWWMYHFHWVFTYYKGLWTPNFSYYLVVVWSWKAIQPLVIVIEFVWKWKNKRNRMAKVCNKKN